MIQNVVIIGAGPAGLLLAHYLLRRGKYHVDERRPDPRLVDASKDRTFPISLQERGRRGIRAAAGLGKRSPLKVCFVREGCVSRKGKARRIPQKIRFSRLTAIAS